MLKFVAGKVTIDNKEIKVMIFCFNHTLLTHGDLSVYLDSVVEHAGFCNLDPDNLFMQFYGRSISVNTGIENMDILKENAFIQNGIIANYSMNILDTTKDIYIITDKDVVLNKEKITFLGTVSLKEWSDLLENQFQTQF